jgi:ParB family chromosome partitioning protein
LIGRRYNRVKKAHGGDRKSEESSGQNDHLKTAESLASDYGVTERTVRRAGQYADAVETINSAAPGFTATVNAGDAPTRQDVVKAASVVAQIPEAAQNVTLAAEFADLPNEAKQDAIDAIAQLAPAQEVMREAVKNYRAIGTGENEWYTPAEYADMAREVMGSIDLDPASCEEANKVIQAGKFYSKEDDGLTKSWKGNLWVNPPYSRDLMPAFVDKLKQSFINGDVDSAILLSHNNTDTAWFHSLASVSSAICFPKKRIKFYRGEEIAAPTNGQAFFYLGDNVGDFADIFGEVGFVVEPIPTEVVA